MDRETIVIICLVALGVLVIIVLGAALTGGL
jgi:hypothetical protein